MERDARWRVGGVGRDTLVELGTCERRFARTCTRKRRVHPRLRSIRPFVSCPTRGTGTSALPSLRSRSLHTPILPIESLSTRRPPRKHQSFIVFVAFISPACSPLRLLRLPSTSPLRPFSSPPNLPSWITSAPPFPARGGAKRGPQTPGPGRPWHRAPTAPRPPASESTSSPPSSSPGPPQLDRHELAGPGSTPLLRRPLLLHRPRLSSIRSRADLVAAGGLEPLRPLRSRFHPPLLLLHHHPA